MFKKFINWLHELLNSQNQHCLSITNFPVYIGWNSISFRREIIEEMFGKLNKIWEIVYFDNIINTQPNFIVYQFRIGYPKYENMSKGRILSITRNIAEEALTRHFRDLGLCFPADNFIATHVNCDLLHIAIAKNNLGFSQIEQLRRNA